MTNKNYVWLVWKGELIDGRPQNMRPIAYASNIDYVNKRLAKMDLGPKSKIHFSDNPMMRFYRYGTVIHITEVKTIPLRNAHYSNMLKLNDFAILKTSRSQARPGLNETKKQILHSLYPGIEVW